MMVDRALQILPLSVSLTPSACSPHCLPVIFLKCSLACSRLTFVSQFSHLLFSLGGMHFPMASTQFQPEWLAASIILFHFLLSSYYCDNYLEYLFVYMFNIFFPFPDSLVRFLVQVTWSVFFPAVFLVLGIVLDT